VRELEPALLANFAELGVTVREPSEAELKPLIDATRGVHEQFREVVGSDQLDAVYAALAKFRGGK